MPLIDHIDGPNRRIYLHSDTVGVDVHPIDIYKEMRALREQDEALRKYDVFLSAYGNVSKGGGSYTERYVVENLGTRIIPYDLNQQLRITGTIITDDGQQGRDCFDRSLLTSTVDIDYQPPQVEVIEVAVGSGLTTEQSNILSLILDILEGDMMPTETEWRVLQKTTKAVLVQKNREENADGFSELTEP